MIEMAQLRVGEREAELPATLAEPHPPVADLHDLRLAAVDQVRPPGMPAAAGRGRAAGSGAPERPLRLEHLGGGDLRLGPRP